MPYKNDLTSNLTQLLKDKKTLVLIDGANLYFAAQSKRWNIDFNNLYNWFADNTNLVETVYYTAFKPDDVKQNEFISNLETSGYTVHKKPIKVFTDSTIKGNLDVEICVDTMKQIFNFQILVLISGDGDFTYLAQTLESMGKKVIVIGVGGFMSYELQEQADNYFLLDRIKTVWQKRKKIKTESESSSAIKAQGRAASYSKQVSKPIVEDIGNSVNQVKNAGTPKTNNLSNQSTLDLKKVAHKPKQAANLKPIKNSLGNSIKKPKNGKIENNLPEIFI